MQPIKFNSYDGTALSGLLDIQTGETAALLVHGITSEKTEGGFYTAIAEQLSAHGVTSLAIDLRSHGESEGEQVDFLMSGAINDICSGIELLLSQGAKNIILVAASFSGGLSVRVAEKYPQIISRLVLFNPRLDYTPWATDPQYWENGTYTDSAKKELHIKGFLTRNGFSLSRAMINELLAFDPSQGVTLLNKPILMVHGTKDTVVPIEGTKTCCRSMHNCTLIEVENAQHGFTDAVTDDINSPESQAIRSRVVEQTIQWVLMHIPGKK